MKIVYDTNIVLDILARREPFYDNSQKALALAATGAVEGAITANTITDIYFVLRKYMDNDAVKSALRGVMELLEVLDVSGMDCYAALDMPMHDYEDAVLAHCGQGWRADRIVTRNPKDFTGSPVDACMPEDLLDMIADG